MGVLMGPLMCMLMYVSAGAMTGKIPRAVRFRFRAILAGAVVLLTLQTAHGEDLWGIYQIALSRDPAYAAAGYEYQRTKLDLPLARTTLLPSISLRGTAERLRRGDNTINNSSTNNSDTEDNDTVHRSSLNADLSLFNLESIRGYTQAKLRVAGAEIRFEDARADLILRVADRYFQVLAAGDNKEVAGRQKTAIQRQMDLASKRLTVGLGTRTDLFDAEARFQQAVADVIAADNRIDNAVQALREITGDMPEDMTGDMPENVTNGDLATLSENAPLEPPQPASLEVWIDRALKNNRALKVENLNLEVAAEEIKKQRAARWPNLDLNLARNWRETGSVASNSGAAFGQNRETDSTSVAATLNWPLFLGGAIHLKTKQAALRYNAAERIREELKRRVESDTTSAYLAVVSGISQVEALSKAIRAGENALRAKEEGFRAGLTTNLDVLDAQRDLSSSHTDYLGARYDFILSVLRLERAAGDLDEDDLKRINAWLTGGR